MLLILLIFNFKSIESFNNNNKYKVVIGGCCRDCEKYLPSILKKIKQITHFCEDYQIIIYENDSQDKTLKILKKFEEEFPNVTILSENGIKDKYQLRTHRLAYCRNKILDVINKSNYHKKYDYFINLDLDNVNTNLDVQSIKKYLDSKFDFDVGTANQKKYYDYWALRTEKYDKNCWNNNGACIRNNIVLDDWFDNYKGTYIDKKEKPIKVISAFEGLGIYKLQSIGDCRYDGIEDNATNGFKEDCEHVKFHKCMIKNGHDKIYIIPFLNNI